MDCQKQEWWQWDGEIRGVAIIQARGKGGLDSGGDGDGEEK